MTSAAAVIAPVFAWVVVGLTLMIVGAYFTQALTATFAARTPGERALGQILLLPFLFVGGVGALCALILLPGAG